MSEIDITPIKNKVIEINNNGYGNGNGKKVVRR